MSFHTRRNLNTFRRGPWFKMCDRRDNCFLFAMLVLDGDDDGAGTTLLPLGITSFMFMAP